MNVLEYVGKHVGFQLFSGDSIYGRVEYTDQRWFLRDYIAEDSTLSNEDADAYIQMKLDNIVEPGSNPPDGDIIQFNTDHVALARSIEDKFQAAFSEIQVSGRRTLPFEQAELDSRQTLTS